jgi:phosphoribosylaminoimidazole-succinocarboxamide synthase
MSDELLISISDRYIELYEKITGEGFIKAPNEYISKRIQKNIKSFLKKI